jgi:deoxyadenosine/deoxycytidine kinase
MKEQAVFPDSQFLLHPLTVKTTINPTAYRIYKTINIHMLQASKSQVPFLMKALDFSFDLILPATYAHGVNSASNKNEYQESL